jgi:AraC-like DNA-binding protein
MRLPSKLNLASFRRARVKQLAVKQCIDRILADNMVLHVPPQEGQMQMIPGMHFHLSPELFIQISGSTDFECPDESFTLKTDELCVMPRAVPHGEAFHDGDDAPFCHLVIGFHNDRIYFRLACTACNQPGVKPYVTDPEFFLADEEMRAKTYIDDVVDAWHSRHASKKLRIRGAILAALAHLLDVLLEKPAISRDEEHPKVAYCKMLIDSHLSETDLTVRQLASWSECSPGYLSNLFREKTGTRLMHYLNTQRITKARELLENTSMNVSEVAYACGYSDPSYFTRIFKRAIGMTPIRYRRKLI